MLLFAAAAGGADIDHAQWDCLLKRYVNQEALVDYGRWKRDGTRHLDAYLRTLEVTWSAEMDDNARKAALINAYNARMVRWIIANYPVKSVWRTDKPFASARHLVDGRNVSLDDIETRLRAMNDARVHAVLVCAARSCPPLRREAYAASSLDGQLDDNARRWLANPALNSFDRARRVARISSIFDWYRRDFESGGRKLEDFLIAFGPRGQTEFLRNGQGRIEFQEYRWGLNDTTALGEDYSRIFMLWDYYWNRE